MDNQAGVEGWPVSSTRRPIRPIVLAGLAIYLLIHVAVIMLTNAGHSFAIVAPAAQGLIALDVIAVVLLVRRRRHP